MAEATVSQTTANTKVSKWTRIEEMRTEMDRLIAQMKQDREEINRLKNKTRANINEIKTVLDRISAS